LAEIAILSQYLASLHAVKRSSGRCNSFSSDSPRRVYNTSRWWAAEFVDGGKQRRSVWQEASTLRRRRRYAVV